MWKTYNNYFTNNISFKCSETTMDLLKTNLTEKQLLLLDKREYMIIVALSYIFFIGLIFGFLLAFLLIKLGVKL